MNKAIRFLYKRYPGAFREAVVEELVGQIPKRASQPSHDFIARSGKQFEEWLLWTSWVIQRRAMSDLRNANFYMGALFQTKVLLSLATRQSVSPAKAEGAKEDAAKAEDPLKGVDDFIRGFNPEKR